MEADCPLTEKVWSFFQLVTLLFQVSGEICNASGGNNVYEQMRLCERANKYFYQPKIAAKANSLHLKEKEWKAGKVGM